MFLCKAAYQKRLKLEQSWEILPPSILSLIIEYADITLKMDDKIVASQYSKRGSACSIIFKSVLIIKYTEISRETCKIVVEGDSMSNDEFLNIISKLKHPTHISVGAREFDSTLLSKYLPNLKGVTFSGYKNFFLSRHFPQLKQIDVRANFNQRPFYVGPNVTDLTMRFKKCKTGTFDSASKITKLDHLRFIQIVDPLVTTFTKFGPVVEPYLRFLENCQVNRLYIEAVSFPSASLKHVPKSVRHLSVLEMGSKPSGVKMVAGVERHMKHHQLESLDIESHNEEMPGLIGVAQKIKNLRQLSLSNLVLDTAIAKKFKLLKQVTTLIFKKSVINLAALELLQATKMVILYDCTFN